MGVAHMALAKVHSWVFLRALSTNHKVKLPTVQPVPSTMSAWRLHGYGALDQLTLTTKARVPMLSNPGQVLIQVHAASVNPVDIAMVGGYGSVTLNTWRRARGTLHNGSEFPITLGRDFSGQIVEIGCGVDRDKFHIGDEVYGAGDVAFAGTHAQFVAVSSKEISHKPKTLTHIEAASLPYVAATSWAAVCTASGYTQRSLANKRVLILGGSGGIGTFAIQWLKAWGAHITTTCSTDCIDNVLQLGADMAIDYTKHDIRQELQQLPGFDLIYDAVGGETTEYATNLLLPYTGATYVRIVLPLLRNNNELGMIGGLAKSACQFSTELFQGVQRGSNVRWGLFIPSGVAMETVAKLVDEKKILPQVERVFAFNDLPAAYEKVATEHNRGKTVIDVIGALECR